MAQKPITELTPEQERKMDEMAQWYETLVLGGDDRVDQGITQESLAFLYQLADLKPPAEIVFCTSPKDLALKAKLKSGETLDCLGQGYDVGWTAFYDYMESVLGIAYDPAWGFTQWKRFITQSGVFATVLYEETAFVCPRPVLCRRRPDGVLHCETGPALAWRDGYEEYCLNGVFVEKELVMTPGNELDLTRWVLKEKNAEIKREAVRRIGVERVCAKLGAKVLDAQTVNGVPYELLALDLGDTRVRPYLKMKNPSIGVYHIEGVAPTITTVAAALEWRNGRPDPPAILS